ncbi:hypothetical protein ACHAPJ_007175 [Fusarium lateritium]
MDVNLGEEVSYVVRFYRKADQKRTRPAYVTDGVLLQISKNDPDFKLHACIIIDEAHERTLAMDVLLALLKRAVSRRPDLKVIVMSATLDADKFVNYFVLSRGGGAKSGVCSESIEERIARAWAVYSRWGTGPGSLSIVHSTQDQHDELKAGLLRHGHGGIFNTEPEPW